MREATLKGLEQFLGGISKDKLKTYPYLGVVAERQYRGNLDQVKVADRMLDIAKSLHLGLLSPRRFSDSLTYPFVIPDITMFGRRG